MEAEELFSKSLTDKDLKQRAGVLAPALGQILRGKLVRSAAH